MSPSPFFRRKGFTQLELIILLAILLVFAGFTFWWRASTPVPAPVPGGSSVPAPRSPAGP